MLINRYIATLKLITKSKVVEIPKEEIPAVIEKDNFFTMYLSDYDEEITTTVYGPLLIEVSDFPKDKIALVLKSNFKLTEAFKIPIPLNKYFFSEFSGEYCAYYKDEKILTTNFLTAISIAYKMALPNTTNF